MSAKGTDVRPHGIQPLTDQGEQTPVVSVSQVKALIRERRQAALAFGRTRDAADRVELERIDQELARHHIDIPAIQQQVAMRKRGNRRAISDPEGMSPSGRG